MNRYIFLAILIYLLISENAFSQIPCTIGCGPIIFNGAGDNNDKGKGICADDNGNFYVCGSSYRNTDDIVLIKYNSNCSPIWTKYYDGPGLGEDGVEGAVKCVLDNQNNIYVAGSSQGIGSGRDIVLLKYNSNGDLLWQQRYTKPGFFDDKVWSLRIDGNNDLYILGTTIYNISSNKHIVLLKYNSSGNLILQYIHNETGSENQDSYYEGLEIDNQNNVYIAFHREVGGNNKNGKIVMFTSSGTITFQPNEVSLGENGGVASIKVNTLGIYLAANEKRNGLYDWVTYKFIAGNMNYIVRDYYVGYGDSFVNSMGLDNTGYVYTTGSDARPSGQGSGSIIIVRKVNPDNPNIGQWGREYYVSTINGNNTGNKILLNNNTVIIASTISNVGTGTDFGLLKYKFDGTPLCVYSYLQNFEGEAIDACINNNNLFYMTGFSNISTNNGNITSVGNSLIGINLISSLIPNSLYLYQNYPNPFNPTTKIKFDVAAFGKVSLRIFSIEGRENRNFIYPNLNPGTYEIEFNAQDLPSGTYIYRLENENTHSVKKMIILK